MSFPSLLSVSFLPILGEIEKLQDAFPMEMVTSMVIE